VTGSNPGRRNPGRGMASENPLNLLWLQPRWSKVRGESVRNKREVVRNKEPPVEMSLLLLFVVVVCLSVFEGLCVFVVVVVVDVAVAVAVLLLLLLLLCLC
jgi:hypothetical protein